MKSKVRDWLESKAFPRWLEFGIDHDNGGFFEELDLDTSMPVKTPKRTMVQCRQIYCLITGVSHGIIPRQVAENYIHSAGQFLISHCRNPGGSFVHSVNLNGDHFDSTPDLYAQAFSLFGLAHLFKFTKDEQYKRIALSLATYLYEFRKLPQGGFSEFKGGGIRLEANPHMHLFEAVLCWAEVDSNPIWNKLSHELYDLMTTKFLCGNSQLLCEHFDLNWNPILEDGCFIIEPGHHYEWSWLIKKYLNISGTHSTDKGLHLFNIAEKYGVDRNSEMVFDELKSDFSVNSLSHRFWPQCERIKAATIYEDKDAANKAVKGLFKFFETDIEGLWYDQIISGQLNRQNVKASSFYHIVNALTDYLI